MPNQPLQLTADQWFFDSFFSKRQVLVCRAFSGTPPPQLNFDH